MTLSGKIFTFEKVSSSEKNELSAIIKSNGGTVQYMLSSKVTHLIIPKTEQNNHNNFTLKKAKQSDCVIVDPDWVRSSGIVEVGRDFVPNFNHVKKREVKSFTRDSPIVSFDAKNAPTISLLLPGEGDVSGDFQIAVFGINFLPGPGFRIKFGGFDAVDFEFHGNTSVICRLPRLTGVLSGDVIVSASNDSGRTYGFPVQFKFIDSSFGLEGESDPTKLALIMSQLKNLRRAIVNIQNMEDNLTNQMKSMTGIGSNKIAISQGDLRTESGSRRKSKERFDREIKIFISSPFRDMQQDRDELIKWTIPRIRKMCLDRDIVFTYVDLRWGVSSSQSEAATTLLLCLREIEESDLFIGFFGERYGWNISDERDTGSNELLARSFELASKEFPWIESYKDRSVTEIEMRMIIDKLYHGEEKPAWFYFRDPYYVEEVNERERYLYKSEGPHSFERLQTFIAEIIDSDQPTRNYLRPSHLAELNLEDLRDYIERKYPSNITLSAERREEFRHIVFSRRLTRLYLPDENYYLQIDKFITAEDKKPLLVIGDSGIGKSALIANWCKRHGESHPEDIIVAHYIGCSPSSASYDQILWRIMNDVTTELEMNYRIPPPSEGGAVMSREFTKWLQSMMEFNKTHNNNRIIIVIDGMDSLDKRDKSHDLVWFPHTYPDRVKLIISSSPGLVSDILRKRNCTHLPVQPLNEAQRNSLVRSYLALQSKKLEDKFEFMIGQARQCENPRFLLTLSDDIALFGEHDNLEDKIVTDLHAQNNAELYEIVLERMSKDYNTEGKDIVATFLSLIWCSRRGLMLDSELKYILEELGIEESDWEPFYIAAQEKILNDLGGLIIFTNDDVRQSVESKYLQTQKKKNTYHSKISDYMKKLEGIAERKIEELPYQLLCSKNLEDLTKELSNLRLFDRLYDDEHKFDLINYWRVIESNTSHRAEKVYRSVVNIGRFPAGLIVSHLLNNIGLFLQGMSKLDAAEEMLLKSIGFYEKASQRLQIAKVYTQLATLYNNQGRHDDFENVIQMAEDIYTKEKGDEAPEIGALLNLKGTLYINTNRPEIAHDILDRALHICQTQLGSDHITTANVYYNLGCMNLGLSELEKAEEYLIRSLHIKELTLGDWDPEVSHILNRLGTIYIEQNQFNDAEACFERALLIREKKLGPSDSRVSQTLKHMISLYEMLEEYEKAVDVGNRALEICKKTYGRRHHRVAKILERLGSILWAKGDNDIAVDYVQEAIDIFTEISGIDSSDVKEAGELLQEIIAPPPPPPTYDSYSNPYVSKPSPFQTLMSDVRGFTAPPPPPPPQQWNQLGQAPPPPPQQQWNQLGQLPLPPQYQMGILPPPPPPGQQQQLKYQLGQVPPPPPPPPPPPMNTKPQMQQQQQEQGEEVKYMKANLRRNAEFLDYDSGAMAKQMVGRKKRKVKLRELY